MNPWISYLSFKGKRGIRMVSYILLGFWGTVMSYHYSDYSRTILLRVALFTPQSISIDELLIYPNPFNSQWLLWVNEIAADFCPHGQNSVMYISVGNCRQGEERIVAEAASSIYSFILIGSGTWRPQGRTLKETLERRMAPAWAEPSCFWSSVLQKPYARYRFPLFHRYVQWRLLQYIIQ